MTATPEPVARVDAGSVFEDASTLDDAAGAASRAGADADGRGVEMSGDAEAGAALSTLDPDSGAGPVALDVDAGHLGGHDSVGPRGALPSLGVASVTGRLDKAVIRRVVRARVNRIRFCYEKELQRDPKLSVKIAPRFVIGADGHVTSVTMSRPSGNAQLDACVLAVVRAFQFPEPQGGGVVVVTYPIALRPDGPHPLR